MMPSVIHLSDGPSDCSLCSDGINQPSSRSRWCQAVDHALPKPQLVERQRMSPSVCIAGDEAPRFPHTKDPRLFLDLCVCEHSTVCGWGRFNTICD